MRRKVEKRVVDSPHFLSYFTMFYDILCVLVLHFDVISSVFLVFYEEMNAKESFIRLQLLIIISKQILELR